MAKPVPTWSCGVKGGVLTIDARGLFAGYVKKLKDGAYTLTLKRAASSRPKSTNQLGYLWGVVYPVIADELGYCDYEIEALHDELMRRLCGLKPEPNPLKLRVSLAEMNHEDVSGYIESVRFFALNELGIITPDAQRAEPARERKIA